MLVTTSALAAILASPTSALAYDTHEVGAAAATVPLVRYYDGLKHWSTTGQKPNAKYREEGRVPILAAPAAGSRPIYSCMNGAVPRDQFLTAASDCGNSANASGNHVLLKLEGYLYTRPAEGRRPIYRCYVPHVKSHFFSVKSDCESNPPTSPVNAEYVLGYIPVR